MTEDDTFQALIRTPMSELLKTAHREDFYLPIHVVWTEEDHIYARKYGWTEYTYKKFFENKCTTPSGYRLHNE